MRSREWHGCQKTRDAHTVTLLAVSYTYMLTFFLHSSPWLFEEKRDCSQSIEMHPIQRITVE